MQYFAKRSS